MGLRFLQMLTAKATENALSPEVVEMMRQGAMALQGGEFIRAVELYSAVLELKRDHAETYYKRANALNGLGRWEAALADFDKAIEFNSQYSNAFCNRGAVLERLGQWDEALVSYESAIAINPDDPLAFYNRGSVLKALGRFDDALASYAQAIRLKADYAEAYINGGSVLRELGRREEALASYRKAIELSPPGFLINLAYQGSGLALTELKRYDDAIKSYDEAIRLNPDDHLSFLNRGVALRMLRRLEAALASFERAIALKVHDAEAHLYRGQVLQEMRSFDAAIESFDQAIELTDNLQTQYLAQTCRGLALAGMKRFDEALVAFDRAIALESGHFDVYFAQGRVFQELRQYETAIASYDKAIALDPNALRAHPAYSSRAFAFKELKRFEDALASYDRAIELADTDADVCLNRGSVLQELGLLDAAIQSYDRALILKPDFVEAYVGRGFSLANSKRHEAAIASFDHALELKPEQNYILAFRRFVQMQVCDWRELLSYMQTLEHALRAGESVTAPFPVLALVDSPLLHRLAAEIWVREECRPDDVLDAIPSRSMGDKIRVGYFSADFREHPVALLTAELFEIHDRSMFEVIAFAFGPKVNDSVRVRLEQAFDRFIDVSDRSDREVVAMARDLSIDIAVDLGGFTEHSRPKIFAMRVAPIQTSYIGYLGTMGAPFMDYLIADSTIIPAEERQHYSEAIIYLPSYQVNDSKRHYAERSLTREELGLPTAGFVFSCFNANYKIMPDTFASWMRILLRVQGSSFFLYAGNVAAERNLRREAERFGVDPNRIVFGKFLPQHDYLARFRTMDLFLDTLPYNAGTTASDALWAGLPVLTRTGRAFAGRVAASLLYALELPELVTSTSDQYEAMAVELAENPQLLWRIKQKLAQNRLRSALFNTRSFAKHLEAAFATIQERHHAGLAPQTIFVKLNA